MKASTILPYFSVTDYAAIRFNPFQSEGIGSLNIHHKEGF